MRARIVWILLILLVSTTVVVIAGLLGGSGASGGALSMIAVVLCGYFAANWGGKQATKTEEYRQALIARRKNPKSKPESGSE
ncbi:hypothetical protein GCM10027562_02640 [Arthrobacter pigmenti]